MDTACSSLRAHGFAVVRVRDADAPLLQACIPVVERSLSSLHASGIQGGQDFGPREHQSSHGSEFATYRERAQMRHRVAHHHPPGGNSAVELAAAVLSRLTRQHLAALQEEVHVGTPLDDGDQQLDAFWYPGEHQWAALGAGGELPAPCPAHEDPGLLTAIYDDRPALQVRLRDGSWRDVELASDEVALVVGRALAALSDGRVPACTHRVQPLQRSRTSLVFEELPNEAALRSRSKAEGAAACSAAATASTADAKYARAAGALLSMGGAAGSRAEGRCVVM